MVTQIVSDGQCLNGYLDIFPWVHNCVCPRAVLDLLWIRAKIFKLKVKNVGVYLLVILRER